jgi:arginyl-tRNA synthetase
VLSDDEALTGARLALTRAVRTVLRNGLGLLGMSAPERM